MMMMVLVIMMIIIWWLWNYDDDNNDSGGSDGYNEDDNEDEDDDDNNTAAADDDGDNKEEEKGEEEEKEDDDSDVSAISTANPPLGGFCFLILNNINTTLPGCFQLIACASCYCPKSVQSGAGIRFSPYINITIDMKSRAVRESMETTAYRIVSAIRNLRWRI